MSEMPFTKALIKKEIKDAMTKSDSSHGEYDFLNALGSIRKRAVYATKAISDKEFDEICQEILDEIEDSN